MATYGWDTHGSKIERQADGTFVAICNCGWRSPEKPHARAAVFSHRGHRGGSAKRSPR